MLKKIAISLLLSSLLFSNDELTGDTKLSCEAILCLSSGERPDECNESIQKYFSIQAKKPEDTIKARLNFLKLCPLQGDISKIPDLENLNTIASAKVVIKDDEDVTKITNNSKPESCSLEDLNANLEEKVSHQMGRDAFGIIDKYVTKIRINPEPTPSCKLLIDNPYANKKPKYTCETNWYDKEEWENGLDITSWLVAPYSDYIKYPEERKQHLKKGNYNKEEIAKMKKINGRWEKYDEENVEKDAETEIFYIHYSMQPINKNCWVWEE